MEFWLNVLLDAKLKLILPDSYYEKLINANIIEIYNTQNTQKLN